MFSAQNSNFYLLFSAADIFQFITFYILNSNVLICGFALTFQIPNFRMQENRNYCNWRYCRLRENTNENWTAFYQMKFVYIFFQLNSVTVRWLWDAINGDWKMYNEIAKINLIQACVCVHSNRFNRISRFYGVRSVVVIIFHVIIHWHVSIWSYNYWNRKMPYQPVAAYDIEFTVLWFTFDFWYTNYKAKHRRTILTQPIQM